MWKTSLVLDPVTKNDTGKYICYHVGSGGSTTLELFLGIDSGGKSVTSVVVELVVTPVVVIGIKGNELSACLCD